MKEIDIENRIIGDCLEINSDIITMKVDDSGNIFSKFSRKIKANKYNKKLISIVEKIRNVNKPLNKDNLLEYFMYIYNNYPPYGRYKHVSVIKKLEERIYIVYKFTVDDKNFDCKFNIGLDEDNFNIVVNKTIDSKVRSYDLTLSKLEDNNISTYGKKDKQEVLDMINKSIVNDICDYVLETINNTSISSSGGKNYV